MTFESVWWHTPIDYAAGLKPAKTWPEEMVQYRRPNDERHYDLPSEKYRDMLYYERPRLAIPKYRGTFRDKPHTVTAYHPSGIEEKPTGYHGRMYYESQPPQFKYQGRTLDKQQHLLENQTLLPRFDSVQANRYEFGTAARYGAESGAISGARETSLDGRSSSTRYGTASSRDTALQRAHSHIPNATPAEGHGQLTAHTRMLLEHQSMPGYDWPRTQGRFQPSYQHSRHQHRSHQDSRVVDQS